MLTFFIIKAETLRKITIIMALLIFSTAANSRITPLNEKEVEKYLATTSLFKGQVSKIKKLDGMNYNFHFSNLDKQYLLCNFANDLIDFRTYISNYSIVASHIHLPKLVYVDSSRKIFIREYTDGKVLQLNADQATIVKAARAISELHNSLIEFPNNLNAKVLIEKMNFLQRNKNVVSKNSEIDHIVQRVYSAIEHINIPLKPCHNDLNASNFIISANNLSVIDWEFSSMNDPAWDLAYFITISRLPEKSVDVFLKSYLSLGNGNSDPTLLDRVTAYQPVTLIFMAKFFDYGDVKNKDEVVRFLFGQAKDLYNSSRVQAALKILENTTKSKVTQL